MHRVGLGLPWDAELRAQAASSAPIHTSVSPLAAAASGFWAPWSYESSANFPLFYPVHAPISALPKDLLLSGPFGSTLGLFVLFLLYWGHQGMPTAHQVWPSLAANLGGGSESSLGAMSKWQLSALFQVLGIGSLWDTEIPLCRDGRVPALLC